MDERRGRARRRPASRGRRAALVAASAFALVLAGCTGDLDFWNPPEPVPVPEPPDRPTVTPPPLPRVDWSAELPALELPGAVPWTAAMAGDGFTAMSRWATPPGRGDFADALRGRAARTVQGFAERNGAGWRPTADVDPGADGAACSPVRVQPAPSITVSCAIVTAAGDVVAERLLTTERRPEALMDGVVLYGDADGGLLGDGSRVFSARGAAQIARLVDDALRVEGLLAHGEARIGDLTGEELRRALDDTVVMPDGSLVVHAPADDESGGRLAVPVRIDATRATPELSAFGRSLRAGIRAAEPFAPTGTGFEPPDCALVLCVALTFDDGPGGDTARLLDELAAASAPATFFVLGSRVEAYPELAAREVREGHQLGNHSFDHPDLTTLDDEQLREQVQRTQDAIAAATGRRVGMLRPPYGAYDERVQELVGLPLVFWSIDTLDWEEPGLDALLESAVAGAERGDIILMHDIHEPSVDAVPAIIAGLRDRGFALATVTGVTGPLPPPGGVVRHG